MTEWPKAERDLILIDTAARTTFLRGKFSPGHKLQVAMSLAYASGPRVKHVISITKMPPQMNYSRGKGREEGSAAFGQLGTFA